MITKTLTPDDNIGVIDCDAKDPVKTKSTMKQKAYFYFGCCSLVIMAWMIYSLFISDFGSFFVGFAVSMVIGAGCKICEPKK